MTIQDLLNSLHTNGYLNASNTQLNLPAKNNLGSQPISDLLGNAVLFPLPQLVIDSGQLIVTSTTIVMVGAISKQNTVIVAFSDCQVTATFTIDAQGVAELSVAASLPDGTVLATAFPGLKPSSSSQASAPYTQVFTKSVLTVMSTESGSDMAFAGIPVPDPLIAGMWQSNPGLLSGPITGWSAPSTTPPSFQFATAWQGATIQAGLLPLSLSYTLASDPTNGGSGAVNGLIAIKGLGNGTIPVAMALPVSGGISPFFATNGYSQGLADLSQLAPLFLGQQIANLVPSRFPIGNIFGLSSVQVGVAFGGKQTAFTQITVSASTMIPLLPLNLADLTGISVTFNLNFPDQFMIVFVGDFQLNGNAALAFATSFTLPGALIQAYNTTTLDVGELITIIPGVPALPQTGLTVELLSASLSPYDMTYVFSGSITASSGWSIDLVPGLTLLALQNLNLTVTQSSTQSSVAIGADVIFLDLPLSVTAVTVPSSSGWIFAGTLNAQSVSLTQIVQKLLPFPCQALPEITLLSLDCSFDSSDNTYALGAKVQWAMTILPITITAAFNLQSHRSTANGPVTYSGSIIGQLDINNLVLDVSYVFSPTTVDITFAYKNLSITYHEDAVDPYVAISLNNSTVGDLFTFLLSFAEPGKAISLSSPWDALQKIGLPNLTVKVHLNTKVIEVKVDISINLGFIDIENFTLVYTRQYGAAKFSLQLTGTFLGQEYGKNGAQPLTWDPLNEAPPVVPGSGTQLFDLEYLGLGQHMTLRGPMPTTMAGVITALENAMVPAGNPTKNPATQLPGLTYDSGSSWLIGTRFTAMSTVDLSVIFNDPNLYGLLIKLSGAKAGVLAGLQFEILYRKISDGLGVYHIELTLPDAMRHLEFGEVSITLPIITIDIYTNGNFKVNAGFPPSLTDFSRSFSVQVFPFIGYGGFYFAVLNGQTATSVPVITNGSFSPVLELGLALQVGVGKTISLGILSGGISITVGGMLQGVLAWYNPNQQNLPSERYYHMIGTVAVVGMVYATVNFGIIQASVSLTVYASVSINVESYKAILLSISAGVSVGVSIKILFIRISFSFSATITESFVIGSDQATPWIVDSSAPPPTIGTNQYRAKSTSAQLRHRSYAQLRSRPARTLAKREKLLRRVQSKNSNLAYSTTQQIVIPVTAVPLISQALATDFGFPGAPAFTGNQAPVMALMTGMATSDSPTSGANILMGFLLEWVIDALGHHAGSASAALLAEVQEALQQPGVADTIFTYDALQKLFVANDVVFDMQARPTTDPGSEIPMAILPMLPEIAMSVPGYSIQFWNDRRPVGDYEDEIQTYFAELAAQFAANNNNGAVKNLATTQNDSLAVFIFRYYFLMLSQNAVQAASDLLGAYSLVLAAADTAGASLTSVTNGFNNDYTARSGDSIATVAPLFSLTAAQLAAANPQYALIEPVPGQTIFIPANLVAYTSIAGDTLAGLAACFGLSQAELQAANPSVDFNALQPGTVLSIPAMRILHTVVAGESGVSIAQDFGIPLSSLEAANPTVDFQNLTAGMELLIPLSLSIDGVAVANQGDTTILQTGTKLSLGDIPVTTQSADSLSALATQFSVALLDLLSANATSQTLLNSGQTIALGTLTTVTRALDSFQGIFAYWYSQATPLAPDKFDAANPTLKMNGGQILSIPVSGKPNASYTTQSGDTVATIAGTFSGLTLSALLANNPLITLIPGQNVALPDVQPITSTSYLFTYTATTDDTLTTIAARFFASNPVTQAAAIQSLQQWNGNLDPSAQLAAGTSITVPYISSLDNLTRQYGTTLAQLAALTQTNGDSLWLLPALLASRAQVTVPAVSHTVGEGESLGAIAQNFDLSMAQLADLIALMQGLFNSNGVTLQITAIPGMNFDQLIQVMATSGSATNAFNMTSRFMMNGLRLPAPQFVGQPAPPPDTAYPLYALIGQEFPVGLPLAANYAFTLTLNGQPAWISIAGGSLNMPLDAAETTRVNDFSTLTLANGITSIHPIPLFAYSPDRQPPTALLNWNTADLPASLVPSGQKVAKPVIWSIPGALSDALAASAGGQLPYAAVSGTTQPDGSVTYTELSATRYATIIDITLEIPQTAPQGCYQVQGADQAGMARLLALWSYMQSTGTGATLYLAYADQNSSSSSGIVVTDNLNRADSFLIKTNLSTESHGTQTVSTAGLLVAKRNTTLSEQPVATLSSGDSLSFLQLLWELSVVKSGGYYLNYTKSDAQLGLPGTLFSIGQQATIQVIAILDSQTAGDPVALAFNNAMIVGDAVDASSQSLAFQAVTHLIVASDTLSGVASDYAYLALTAGALCSINQEIMGTMVPGAQAAGQTVLYNDSFGSLAARAGLTPAALGQQIANQTNLLQPGALLQLAGNPEQTVAAGDTLNSISENFDFLDPQSLAALNETAQGLLAVGAVMTIPGQAPYTIQTGDTFISIARAKSVDLSILAQYNADAGILAVGAVITVAGNMLILGANLPPGNIGFAVTRTDPQAQNPSAETSQQALNTLFNLLGFQLAASPAYASSNEGLPAGPTIPNGAPDGTPWSYQQILSLVAFATSNYTIVCSGLPPAAQNPYAGIGPASTAILDLALQDVLGNRTQNAVLSPLTQNVGYTDKLLALSAWPSSTLSYRFAEADSGNLHVAMTIASSQFLPDDTALSMPDGVPEPIRTAAGTQASNAALQYQNASYQLQQPDVTASLVTSLGAITDPDVMGMAALQNLLGVANSAYVFLNGAANLIPQIVELGPNTSFKTVADLIQTGSGYPVLTSNLGKINANARADLLWGLGSTLAVPYDYIAGSGDTAQSITTRSAVPITITQLADQNSAVPLAAGILISTAVRSWSVPSESNLSLSAIAQQIGTQVQDGPGGVAGVASSNATVSLATGLTLDYQSASFTVAAGQSLTDAAAAFTKATGTPVTVNDVAMANQYLDGVFAAGTPLSVTSVMTVENTDTLVYLAETFGPPAGQTGTPVEQMLAGNAEVPGIWGVGTPLFIANRNVVIALGDTLASLALANSTQVGAIFDNNATVAFVAGASLAIPYLADFASLEAALYAVQAKDTLGGVAAKFPNWSVIALAELNALVPGLFTNTPITLNGHTATPTPASTITSVAASLDLSIDQFATQAADLPGILALHAAMVTVPMAATGKTLGETAALYGFDAGTLVSASATLPNLVPANSNVTVEGTNYPTFANDSFALLTARINADRATRTDAATTPVSVSDVGLAASSMIIGSRTLLAPPLALALDASVTPSYASVILDLSVTLTVSRDPDWVAPGFLTAPQVVSSRSAVPAQPFSAAVGASTQSLTAFAQDFETAFPGQKLTTGPDQIQGASVLGTPSLKAALSSSSTSSAAGGRSLWVVNFTSNGDGITYQVTPNLRYFAIPPLSTKAWDGTKIAVPSYDSTSGLTWPPNQTQDFRSADPDLWNQTFLAAVDLMLSPAYAVPGATNANVGASITQMIAAKANIAAGQAGMVQPIVQGAVDGLDDAVQTMKQQLLVTLSSAYTVQTLVQTDVNVSGQGAGGDSETQPQLSGKLVANTIITPDDNAQPTGWIDPSAPFLPLANLSGVSAEYLADLIAQMPSIIRPNLTASFDKKTYTTLASDTISTIAAQLNTTPSGLAAGMTLAATDNALFQGATAINVTPLKAPANLVSITLAAGWMDTDIPGLLSANGGRTGFFAVGSTVTLGTNAPYTPTPTDTLDDTAAVFGGAQSFAQLIAGVDAGSLTGGYTLNSNDPPHGLQVVPQLGFTTAKAPLASAGSVLTSLFSVKDPSVQKSVILDLDYRVNQIEFDIHSVAGIQGYQSSSWLSFIIPLTQGTNTQGSIGTVQIPVPLRGYPNPAVVSGQSATPPDPTSDPSKTLAQWDYDFTISRQFAAQDQLTLAVMFNQTNATQAARSASVTAGQDYTAVIQALAAFISVWPAISQDLSQIPDIQNGQASPSARNAASALAQLTQLIETAWNPMLARFALAALPARTYTYVMSLLSQGEPPYYASVILDRQGQSTDFSQDPDDFLFQFDGTQGDIATLNGKQIPASLGTLFAANGFVLGKHVTVELMDPTTPASNTQWMVFDSSSSQTIEGNTVTAPQTYRLQQVGTSANPYALQVWRQLLWPGLQCEGKWLNALQIGSSLSFDLPDQSAYLFNPLALSFDFYRLNALLLQNAWGSTFVSRNANLLQGQTINTAFVYQTPAVMFPTQITPLIARSDPEPMTSTPGQTLAEALSAFFETLVAAQMAVLPNTTRNMRIGISCWQSVDGKTNPADTPLSFRNPLVLLPVYAFNVSTDWQLTANSFCGTLAATIENNAAAMGIVAASPSQWVMDVLVYTYDDSDGTQPPALQALLNLENLTQDI